MPFAATWIDLKIIILSEVSQTKTNDITYMWNLKVYKFTKQMYRCGKQTYEY